ncbi:MAG TPA: two-component regulator propeller domain-containing protein [Flavitalea sp.]|nr:two-component regulator propeller domain-containing protein [Flavitalea sp.]
MPFIHAYWLRVALHICTFQILSGFLFAQEAPELSFKHISNEEGLSNSTIECILQDKKGFMWFGTRDGLNRYDGYQMTVYRYDPRDTNTISDNYIRCIYEDRDRHLWIGTDNGLNCFDPDKNRFVRYKHNSSNARSISHNLVNCIYEDNQRRLWIGTFGGGLNLFDSRNHSFIHFRHEPGNPFSLADDRVNYLFEDSRADLWLATESGINLFNRQTGRFALYQNLEDPYEIRANNAIRVIQESKQGSLWLGSEDNGLFVFDPVRLTFKQYDHREKIAQSLASNQIRSLLVDRRGALWVGSINGGLDLFNERDEFFFHYQNDPNNQSSLSQRTVSALYEDLQGNLWVGTHRGGINLFMPSTEKFTLFRQRRDENSLSYNDVKAFCEDSRGNIWIGTDGGGLNLFDRKKNSFIHYKYDPFNPRTIGSNEVLDITEDSEANLWVGTWGGGVSHLNRSTGTFTRYLHDPFDINSISSNYVQAIFEDSRKKLWIATYYGGLNLFDPSTKKFQRVTTATKTRTAISGKNIISINEDRNGKVWIGTDDGGLNCYDTKTDKFSQYFHKEPKAPDLRVIFIDSKGRLWIGQTGLYLFDATRDSFFLYTNKAGLSTEFIKGIAEDKQGKFWIATSNGLTEFDPETYDFRKYNTADGLQGLEYEANAFMKTRDGQMYFGGVNGFNVFYPEQIRINKFIPPVYITDFHVFNEKIVPGSKDGLLQSDISVTKKITLSYKQSTFFFSFAALNYAASENNQYAYKLEGFEENWNYVGKERKASYTNIGPGEYTFRIKASNNDGLWNEKGPSIQVIITPPFRDTLWFRVIVFIGIVSGAIAFYRFKRRLEWRKLEEKKREEMHQVQLQFFTNISHEFRTPLSLILGPLEKLLKEDANFSARHYYKIIYRNANRLMGLINELMDFRKAASGILKLHVMPGNLNLFFQEISEEFSDLAQEKKVSFMMKVPEQSSEIWFDRQVLEKIVINLISNSFKYTADGGTITVETLDSLENFKPSFENELILKNDYRGKKYFHLRVADNGIGISKESIQHLFERYYKISESHLGSGIGLAFVRSLTSLHKGHIGVYSERNQGTEIIVSIPVSKEDYDQNERWIGNNQNGEGFQKLESIQYKYEHYFPSAGEHYIAQNEEGKLQTIPHILIVDDNEELRKFLEETLSPQYKISHAGDGQSGLIKAKDEFPDLIISDVMMPGMSGIELCRLIKNDIEVSHIPFIMLTAKDALESKIEGVWSGADFYFAKPVSIDLLLLTIRNIFLHRQKLKERYFKNHHIEAKELVHSQKDREFMEQLLEVIDSQLTNPDMDVDYICNSIGMSRTKLYQKVKGITGQSITEFVRSVRLRKAVQMMTQEDILLTDVMYRVGIQTQSYFTKAFKKEFGKTPSQFLHELKK